jgi:hypothetical protein
MDLFTIIIFIILGIVVGKIIHKNNKDNQDHNRYISNIRKLQRHITED